MSTRRAGALPVGEKAPRRDIQGLRGIAVLLVLLAHAGVPGLAGGFMGVDVFFVLSGFLITGLLVREVRTTGRLSIGGFYARRARRILPAATVVLLATVAAATLLLPFVEVDRVGRDALWAAFFAANIHYALEGTDYFAADLAPSAFQHFWSLAVEEQFYIVWPLAVLALAWWAARRGRRTTAGTVAVVAGLAVAASFGWSLLVTSTTPGTAYFSTFARAWELGVGALLACVAVPLSQRLTARARSVLAAAGLVALVVAVVSVDASTPWPGVWATLPVLGTAAILAAGLPVPRSSDATQVALPGPTPAGRVVELAPLRWLGDVSYSLYLWHWPFLVIVPAWLGRDLSVLEASGLMLLAVPVAALSYHLVEMPFRRPASTEDRRSRLRALSLWPAALAVSVAAVVASGWWVTQQQESAQDQAVSLVDLQTEQEGEASAPGDDDVEVAPEPEDEVLSALRLVTTDAAQPASIPFPLGQDLLELNDDRVQFDDRCTAEPDETSHDICPAGDTDSPVTVVLLGDSHLNMWSPGFDEVARAEGVRIVPLIKFGCTPMDLPIKRADVGRRYDECARWRSWSLERIAEIQPAAVVVGTHTHFQALGPDDQPLEGQDRNRAWEDGVRRTAEALAPLTDDVRVLGDLNFLDEAPADCLSRRGATIGDCTFPVSDTVRRMDRLAERGVAGTGAELVPLTDSLCVEDRCPLVAGDLSVYRDVQHVSASWAEFAVPRLWRELDLPTP